MRVEDGRVAEHGGATDNMGLIQRLGAMAVACVQPTHNCGRNDHRRAQKSLFTFRLEA